MNGGFAKSTAEMLITGVTANNQKFTQYWFARTNNFNLNLHGNYRIAQSKPMRWKHYTGAFLSFNDSEYKTHTYMKNIDPIHDGEKIKKYSSATRINFGLNYFGKIDFSNRIAAQYLFYYSTHISAIRTAIHIPQPKNQAGFNFGLGWRF